MSAPNQQLAWEYLHCSLPHCLHWVDNEVIRLQSELTVTFRQELALVLEMQVGQGLPPFGSIVLLLAACRDQWADASSWLLQAITEYSTIERTSFPNWIGDLLNSLESVNRLPREVIQSPNAKAMLVDYVFDEQGMERTSPAVASCVVQLLKESEFPPRDDPRYRQAMSLWHVLSVLQHALRKFDPAAFIQRMRTGVERLIIPVEVELPPAVRTRQLLRDLADDPELGGLARLARQMLAAVVFPRSLAQPDELPLGGVSDISNRGQLDRLLVSELANDDLTLAVRIASQEALYLHREQPRSFPPLRRKLLIDSGIRMWGLPRIFAASLGIAVTATSEKGVAVEAYRASGAQLTPIDFSRREGIESHLNALESAADLSAALPALSAELKDEEGCCEQALLVTSPAALADPKFLRKLREAGLEEGWIASVSAQGELQIYQLQRHALVGLRTFRFDLEKILAPTKKKQPAVVQTAGIDLPAYCRMPTPPLRVPHDLVIDHSWHVPGLGVLSLHQERLTLWQDKNFGPVELRRGLGKGKVHWCEPRATQATNHAVVGTLSQRGLLLIKVELATQNVTVERLELGFEEQPIAVAGSLFHIFVISPKHVSAFDLEGRLVDTKPIPDGLKYHRGRFFLSATIHCYFLTCEETITGGVIKFENYGRYEPPVFLLAPNGESGLVSLYKGNLERLFKTERHSFNGNVDDAVIRVSRDDRRVIVTKWTGSYREIDVLEGTARQVYSPDAAAEPEIAEFLSQYDTPRKHFRGIAFDIEGQLVLQSRKGQWLTLHLSKPDITFIDGKPPAHDTLRFQHFQTVDDCELDLSRAKWELGNEAWLDPRGLLHLKCTDPKIPELTLVLKEGYTAGWFSDGRYFGRRYYLGPDVAESSHPAAELAEFFRQFRVTL